MGYSRLYLDHLAGAESAGRFYSVPSIDQSAQNLDRASHDRDRMASILEKQNRLFGASDETQVNIERLRDKNSLCMFAGQQAGLFGGPLLVMMKALGIVKAARLYSRQLGRPVIPIFWIGGDDHDFDEINHTFVLDRRTSPVRVTYGALPEHRPPASEIVFRDADELNRAKELLRKTLGDTDFTGELYRLIDNAYTCQDTFVSAFGKFMSALTGELGLVFFSPGDAEVKRHAVPFFEAVLDKQEELHQRLEESNRQIVQSGYHIQVEKSENATHLFYNREGRRPILRAGDRFAVGNQLLLKAELTDRIRTEPERFSPDVMTRPVLQSYLFPVLSQKAGPSELAYLAQTDRIFELFDLTPPFYVARPSATLVEKRFAELMHRGHIEFGEVTGDIEQVVNRILSQTFPADVQKGFALLREDIEYHIEKFTSETLGFDPALEKSAQQTFGRIDFALKNFEGKVFAAHKKKSSDVRDRIYRLHNALFPERRLQERSLNVCSFLSRYGLDFVSFLYENLDSEETAHQVIDLTEFSS